MSKHLFACALEIPAGEIPEQDWYRVAQVGRWEGHPSGRQEVTPEKISAMHAYFQERYRANHVDLPVDWDHQTLARMTSGKPASAPRSGHILDTEIRANGQELWAQIRWTPQARETLQRREYRYLSPVFAENLKHALTGKIIPMVLHSIGLTNTPFLTELPAVANATGAADEAQSVATVEDSGMELLKALAALMALDVKAFANSLGVGEGAGDEDVRKAVVERLKRLAGLEAAAGQASIFANALGMPQDVKEADLKAKIDALQAGNRGVVIIANALDLAPDATVEAITKAIGDLRQANADTRAERLIANAVEGGKIPPSMRDKWLAAAQRDYAGTEAIVGSLTRQVGGAAAPAPRLMASELTADEKVFANSLQVSESDLAGDKAEFAASEELRGEFKTFGAYASYRAAERQGRVKLYGRK